IAPAKARRLVQVALAEGRAAAARALADQAHGVTRCLKDGGGGDANLRLVIADESIVPEQDFAANGFTRGRTLCEPTIEALLSVGKQRPFAREAQGFF